MSEPNSFSLAVTTLSAALLALLGVDYYALLWGIIGAIFSLSYLPPMGKRAAVATVVISSMIGAAFGTALAEKTGSRSLLIVLALVAAAGAQPIMAAAVRALVRRVARLGGTDTPPDDRNAP